MRDVETNKMLLTKMKEVLQEYSNYTNNLSHFYEVEANTTFQMQRLAALRSLWLSSKAVSSGTSMFHCRTPELPISGKDSF